MSVSPNYKNVTQIEMKHWTKSVQSLGIVPLLQTQWLTCHCQYMLSHKLAKVQTVKIQHSSAAGQVCKFNLQNYRTENKLE